MAVKYKCEKLNHINQNVETCIQAGFDILFISFSFCDKVEETFRMIKGFCLHIYKNGSIIYLFAVLFESNYMHSYRYNAVRMRMKNIRWVTME